MSDIITLDDSIHYTKDRPDGFKRISFIITVSNMDIDNEKFDVLKFVKKKANLAFITYKRKKQYRRCCLLSWGHIFITTDYDHPDTITRIEVLLHSKPI